MYSYSLFGSSSVFHIWTSLAHMLQSAWERTVCNRAVKICSWRKCYRIFITACLSLNKIFETCYGQLCKYFGFSFLFSDKFVLFGVVFFFCNCMSVFNEEERERCYKRLNIRGRIELLDYFKMWLAFGKGLRTHAISLKVACLLEC